MPNLLDLPVFCWQEIGAVSSFQLFFFLGGGGGGRGGGGGGCREVAFAGRPITCEKLALNAGSKCVGDSYRS